MSDLADSFRDYREHARRKKREAEFGVRIAGVHHRDCGGDVMLQSDGRRECDECLTDWPREDDGLHMAGKRTEPRP